MSVNPEEHEDRNSLPREGNLAACVADRIRARILEGQLGVGDALRERELCDEYSVSRIPVREALRILAGEGLVVLRPNRGAQVVKVSVSEVGEIAEACRLLECHILELAVPRIDVGILDEAEKCLERLEAAEDPRAWSQANWAFHTTLYGAAERPLILDLLNRLRGRAERAMLILVADRARRKHLDGEHRALLARVRAGDPEGARELLDAHLSGGKDEVVRLLGDAN